MNKFEKLFVHIGIELPLNDRLKEAFTHRSVVNEKSKHKAHNERLEFLGDAVLELGVTRWLFEKFPDKNEGELTALRASLVRGENLAQVANKLDLGSYMILSKGEEKSGGRKKDYLLANLVEALIGVIFVEKGMRACESFIQTFITVDIDQIIENKSHISAKSEFQEYAQAHLNTTPSYRVLDAIGKDHEKTFVMAVYVGETQMGQGQGSSKKDAADAAATDALNIIAKKKREKMTPKNYILRLVARREYCEFDIWQKTTQKFPDQELEIKTAITELIELNMINDARFVSAFVRDQKLKKFGPHVIRQKCKMRNLDTDLVEKSIAVEYPVAEQYEIVKSLIDKKKIQLAGRNLSEWEKTQKINHYLFSRGFDIPT